MKTGYFIAGTDTGVGKTLVASAFLHAFARQGLRAAGMKPVAAGCEGTPLGPRCDDVEQLRAAGNVAAPSELINPYGLLPPVAPHIAAAQAGIEIDLERIATAFGELRRQADVVVVEGVGGFIVPLNGHQDTADLVEILGLPVILVVGMRLGCINHALLTAEAIARRGLTLTGWVANRIDPAMAMFQENLQTLQQRLPAPLLGTIPYGASAEETAGHLRMELLPSV